MNVKYANYVRPVAAMACLWAVAGCFTLAQAQQSAPEQTLEYHILAAEMAGQRGNLKVAAREYLAAAKMSHNAELAERATRVALYSKQNDIALQALQIWTALEPANVDAQEFGVGLALDAGNLEDAQSYAQAYLDLYPQGVAAAFRKLGRIMGSSQLRSKAGIDILRQLARIYPEVPEADYAIGLVELRNQQPASALKALNKALAERPGWNDAIVLKSTALIYLGKLTQAEHTLAAASGGKNEQAAVYLVYGRLLLEAGKEDEAAKQFRKVLEFVPEQPAALHVLGLMALRGNQPNVAYGYLKKLYGLDPRRQSEVAFYLGNIEEHRGNYAQAAQWYAKVEDGEYVFQAANHRAYALARLGKLKQARQLLQTYRSHNPEDAANAYLSEAALLYTVGDFKSAAQVYDQALAAFPNNQEMLYGRALVSEQLGHMVSAEQDLRRLLALAPNDARTLNALGYILATQTRRYGEARGYIQKAYQQKPEDPAINDSLGWVIYKQGHPQEALPYLQRAYKSLPEAEVAAHLGEVLWVLGQHEQAQAIWRKGLSNNPNEPILNATIRRLLR